MSQIWPSGCCLLTSVLHDSSVSWAPVAPRGNLFNYYTLYWLVFLPCVIICMSLHVLPGASNQTPFPQFLFSWPPLGEPDWEARTVLFNAIFRQADDVAKWWALWRGLSCCGLLSGPGQGTSPLCALFASSVKWVLSQKLLESVVWGFCV